MVMEQEVKEKLKEVKDPHMGLDIVSLGFVKNIEIEEDKVDITIVLTSPGCPMAQKIAGQAGQKLEEMEEVEEAEVELDLEYNWSPEDMSEEAKEKLGHLF